MYAFGNIYPGKTVDSQPQQFDSGFFDLSPTEQPQLHFPPQKAATGQTYIRRQDHCGLVSPLPVPPALSRSLSLPVHFRVQEQQQFIGHPSGLSPVSPIAPPTFNNWQAAVRSTRFSSITEENSCSSDDEQTHPNKYPVAIEEHRRPECGYKRQPVKSGQYMKVIKDSGDTFSIKQTNPETLVMDGQSNPPQIMKFYRKDLVRVCRCGLYNTQECMLSNNGRPNDCDGYEVHYNQKCRWKSYEDFKTKRRVLIRLCKCYKPT